VSEGDSGEPSAPTRKQFEGFVARLLRVPKAEIEKREKARKRRPPPRGGDKVIADPK
jgi:hypothetical protein